MRRASGCGARAMPMTEAAPSTGRGHFFAVDHRSWAKVCDLGMNAAVAYLVLARGTGADNRKTAWSRQAIEKYTSVSRSKAAAAIATLIKAGAVRQTRDSSTRPQYSLASWGEQKQAALPQRAALTTRQQALFDQVKAGQQPLRGEQRRADDLAYKGWLRRDSSGAFHVADDAVREIEAEWIWLPNELVTGAVGETPPVEMVRQTQDVLTLRLLVDLYRAHDLREGGGVARSVTWQTYERVQVGQRAQFIVWGFRYEKGWVRCTGVAECHYRTELTKQEKAAGENVATLFFRRLEALVDVKLVEWIPHLFEGDMPEAEIIHPYGLGASNSLEDRISLVAHVAAQAMLTAGQREWAAEKGLWLAPVPRHIANVQMIGVARLRYRPRTSKTAAWWADLNAKGERLLDRYVALTSDSAGEAGEGRTGRAVA